MSIFDMLKPKAKPLNFMEACIAQADARDRKEELWIRPKSWRERRICMVPDGFTPNGKTRIGPYGTRNFAYMPLPKEIREEWEVLTPEEFGAESDQLESTKDARE